MINDSRTIAPEKLLFRNCKQENDVPPNQIIQVTGHKNIMSVNNYSSLSEGQQEAISTILSANSTTTSTAIQSSETQLQTKQSDSIACSSTKTLSSDKKPEGFSLFHGSVITGGTINVHLAATGTDRETTVRKRRIQILESSESSQETNTD